MNEKMMAYVLHGIGNLQYEKVTKPVPLSGEVLVRVKAAGICGSDIPRIYQTGAYHYPLIPGHEFSGQVEKVGEGVDKCWEGKRVGVFPLIPCGECPSCKARKYEMCRQYNYLGSRTNGGFAEYVRVPEWNLIELPDKVTYEQAAMLEPMAVAVHAIRQSGLLNCTKNIFDNKVAAKDTMLEKPIAVCGLGTIGLFIIMFLKNMGYRRIYAIGNKDSQRSVVEKMGIDKDYFCNDFRENFVEGLLNRTEGVDLFFDCVGKNEVLTLGVNSIAPGGIILLVGNPSKDVFLKKEVYWKLLRSQVTVKGTWNSSFLHEELDDWNFTMKCLEKKCIHTENLITHRFGKKDLAKGFELMFNKSEDYIKVLGLF